jgi:hypothetical protein
MPARLQQIPELQQLLEFGLHGLQFRLPFERRVVCRNLRLREIRQKLHGLQFRNLLGLLREQRIRPAIEIMSAHLLNLKLPVLLG